MKTLILFIALNTLNVILQTTKSLCTIKTDKITASIINALAYGFYTVIVVAIGSFDLPLLHKCLVVGSCNLIGVYVVKLTEEKMTKAKLWKIEAAVNNRSANAIAEILNTLKISFNTYSDNKGHAIFNIFCYDKHQSALVKNEVLHKYKVKYFISETRSI